MGVFWRRQLCAEAYVERLQLREPEWPFGSQWKLLLTNQRQDHYDSFEVNARRQFTGGYSLFVSYTRSSARTNAALDYVPTISLLGPQQSGPLPWNTPNRTISWGWLPVPLPMLHNRWDLFTQLTGKRASPTWR